MSPRAFATRSVNGSTVSCSSYIGATTLSSSGSRFMRAGYRRTLSGMPDDAAVERELFEVGRRLADALPTTRNPLKAIDDKAMDLASSDVELKAALFRFVDVVPAAQNLDDLAHHLLAFLDEVDSPPPPIGVAMKMGNSKAGRRALGMAAATGVKHMARRFIVGESPKAALGDLRGPVEGRRRVLGGPAGRGDGHAVRGAALRGPLRGGAGHDRRGRGRLARAPAARARFGGPAPAREPVA